MTQYAMAALALSLAATAAAPALAMDTPASAACPPTTVFNTHLDHLDGYRVFLGPDGDSKIERIRIDGKIMPLLKTGKKLGVIDLPTSPERGVQIVIGPPDVLLPLHPTPYKEMFILLGGSLTMMTKTDKVEVKHGEVMVMDDVGAKTGHGGQIGPCGYISLSIKP